MQDHFLGMAARPGRSRVRALTRWLACGGFLVIVTAMLTGCVETPTLAHAAPKAVEGGVLLKVSDNLLVPFNGGGIVTVRRMPDAQSSDETCFLLHTSTRGEVAGVLLGGALPAGNYQFPTIGAEETSVGACNRRTTSKTNGSAFGKFTVSAGKLTYLGVLERSPGPRSGMSLMVPMERSPDTDVAELVRESFPDLRSLAYDPSLGWLQNSFRSNLATVQRQALAQAYGMASPTETTNGTWIFGTRAGMVRVWEAGHAHGDLRDTGRRFAIAATAVLADGSWLVGGEESVLLRSADEGKSWVSVRGNLPFGLIEHVASIGQETLLTLVDGKDVSVYRGRLDIPEWTKVASFQTEFTFWTGIPGQGPQTVVLRDHYFVSLPSRRLGVYHVASGTSEVLDLPGSIAELKATDDGVLRSRCVATIAMNPYESHDLGKTWQSSSFNRYSSLPAMRDARHGVTVYRKGAFDDPFFAWTEDGGKVWHPVSPAFSGLPKLFYGRGGQTAYATDGGGMLVATHDGGKRWELVMNAGIAVEGSTK